MTDTNTGNGNTGYSNTGEFNTGSRNTCSWNTGNGNTGSRNTGSWNTGDFNTGDWNTGDFNTTTPKTANYFNVQMEIETWENAEKPDWIFKPSPTSWVPDYEMTDAEKAENPSFQTCGGYMRVNDMREEWRKAYSDATPEDIQMVRDLPNFDAAVFEEITGLDLRVNDTPTCDGKEVEIDGVKYKLIAI